MAYRRAALVAVLADVHGNLPALSAVLAEPDVAAADAVVLLGDIALGPMPAQTLEVLAGLGERAIWVHGNCERQMVAAFDGVTVPGPNGPQASASAALISRRHRDLLDRLPLTVTLEIDGLGVCGFCHASPRRDDEMLLVDSPAERWDAALSGLGAEVGTVVCGHTHMPFDRLAAGRRVVNPGSVGMPYGPPGAHWGPAGARYLAAPYPPRHGGSRRGDPGQRVPRRRGVGPRVRASPLFRYRGPHGVHRDRPPAGRPGAVTA